jgi:hypothetical protein
VKKFTKQQQEALMSIQATLDDMPLKESGQYEFRAVVEDLIKSKYVEWNASQDYRKELIEAEMEREKQRKKQEKRDAKIANWVVGNVFVGDIVKMSGTRDGHGIRKVERVVSHGDWYVLECRAYDKIKRFYNVNSFRPVGDIPDLYVQSDIVNGRICTTHFEVIAQMTTHKPEKVVAVLRNKEMVRVENLMG